MPNQPRKSPKQQLAELFAQADLSYFLTETDDAFVQSVATVGGWSPLGNTRPADPLNFPGFSETGDAKTGMKPWPEERNVSAEVIRWLCVNKAAAALVSGSGISIFGARIVGELNLSFAEIPFPISLRCCRVINSINLTGARIPTLILTGSWTGPIAADSADIKTDIRLDDGFRCDGGIGFWGARIGGALLCSEARSFALRRVSLTGTALQFWPTASKLALPSCFAVARGCHFVPKAEYVFVVRPSQVILTAQAARSSIQGARQ